MTESLKLTPTEALTVRQIAPEALEVEALYGANGSPPPRHFHPAQAEHFEVLSGTVHTRVAGSDRTLQPGETLDVPARAVHQMWNEASEPARVFWRTTPAGRTLEWFRAIDALHRSGRVGGNGMPGPLAFAVLLNEYRDVFRLAGPDPVLRAAFALLAPLGRMRGYRAAAPTSGEDERGRAPGCPVP